MRGERRERMAPAMSMPAALVAKISEYVLVETPWMSSKTKLDPAM